MEVSNRSESVRWIRAASMIPLLAIAVAWLLVPAVRSTLAEGVILASRADLPGMRQWAAVLGWLAPLVTGVLMIVQAIAAPIPAVLVTAANSFLFGPFWGGLYSIFTANVAAAICYGLGRGYGTLLVDYLVSRQAVLRYESFFRQHGWLTVLIARLIPFVPFDPVSYVAGIVRMPFWMFFWATLAGQFPAGMAYSYLVQQVDQPKMLAIYGTSMLAALMLTGWLLHRVFFADQQPADSRTRTREER
jgi:uncharacterized membrane protein YdjX (TVP38/TMEM64 family)